MKNVCMNSVLIVGDIMLDKYYIGKVERISPEAPIPVVKVENERCVLGGAANVAANVASLGAKVGLVGIIGNDTDGEEVCVLLKKIGITSDNLVKSKTRGTNVKCRIIGNTQQIARLDSNESVFPSQADLDDILDIVKRELGKYDLIVISDYDKGVCSYSVCQKIIGECALRNKTTLVDPKGSSWKKYEGATMVTPNLKEVSQYIGREVDNSDKQIEINCCDICKQLGINNLLITRSEKGMSLTDGDAFIHLPSKAKEVYDVSGAGDTVIATIAAFFNRLQQRELLNYANTAAGLVVGKRGTSCITYAELITSLSSWKKISVTSKIQSRKELILLTDEWKARGESIVVTNGCFDILHRGHVTLIYSAAELGDRLIVAINSDKSVQRLKGNDRPINNEIDRAFLIAALACVDAVIIFEEDTPEDLLKDIKPDILVKGGDYQNSEIKGQQYAKEVVLVPFIQGYSTSNIVKSVKNTKGLINERAGFDFNGSI